MAAEQEVEDMALTEAALDAEWKKIQKKTFTRWCNEHLKKQNMKIEDLAEDFSDGIKLIVLLELLSGKKVGRYSKRPRVHAQRMENVEMALDFIMKKERIRLVNIGSGDIVSGNLKLILGLIWTLILHYQISMGFGIDADDGGKKGGLTPKQALLDWLRRKLPHKTINNFTADWNDGTLVAALVDAMAPGLCPENEDMDPENAYHNASHAMKLAEDWLEVPQLLGPEDMVNPHVDELSMMTYLSQYPDANLKPGAPIKARGDASKVKVYGPGVEKDGLDTDMPTADFVVDASEAGGVGKVKASCVGPDGQPVDIAVKDNGDGTYQCSYEPKDVGQYEVKVDYNNKPAGQSPYRVNVAPGASMPKPDQVRAYGPGLEKAVVNKPAEFTVDASNAGLGDIGLAINGPAECQVDCVDNGDGTFHCTYVAPKPGLYNIDLKFADKDVSGAPFSVKCERPPPDASKCVIKGIENPGKFKVDCVNAGGSGLLEVGVSGAYVPCEYVSVRHNGDFTFDVSYDIREPGETTISVSWHGQHLKGSPFTVVIGEAEV